MHTPLRPRSRQHISAILFLFLGVGLPLALFGELAEDVVTHENVNFDLPLLQFVQNG
jgi:hypothetical protein